MATSTAPTSRGAARARLGLLGLLLGSGLAVAALHGLGRQAWAGVVWSDPLRWLATTPLDDSVMALLRVLALAGAWWLLASTALYALARISRSAAAIRGVSWAVLPGAARLADRAVAASLLVVSVSGAAPAMAHTLTAPPIAVATELTAPEAAAEAPSGGGIRPPGVAPPGARPADGDASSPQPAPHVAPPRQRPAAPAAQATPAPEAASPSPGATPTEPPAPPAPPARSLIPASQPAATPSTPTLAPGDAAADTPGVGTHLVERGDSVWSIAAARFVAASGGTADAHDPRIAGYWAQVVRSNLGQLRSGDPDLIHPGERITLPDPTPWLTQP